MGARSADFRAGCCFGVFLFIIFIIANLVHSNDIWFISALQNWINPNADT
jgi:hypothetical protein